MNEQEILELMESDEFHQFVMFIMESMFREPDMIIKVKVRLPEEEKKLN